VADDGAITLMMEAVRPSETLVNFCTTQKTAINNTMEQISTAVTRLTFFGLYRFRATAMLLFYILRNKIIVNKI
jgi:hypothetical protein